MKNSYKFALGLLVAVLAIGFSAFKNNEQPEKKKVFANYTFVHSAANNNNARTQFTYDPTPGGCSTSSNTCRGVWSQSEAPEEGDNPAADAVFVSPTTGTYQPN
ncbi:hypothetical protein FMM05_19300 [Flavobacterium zepuense]|uniref:Uncharacterized protein n=1 Tax=Flavobacterium zepuense TaxID=2593302 RepID=A0A552UUS2_9FLAO|nr:hypothetical protein [Flavobacterium zepuense]TRW21937.1 hypothetical protein FMM05_19300 [Flavobacterium zepuense]